MPSTPEEIYINLPCAYAPKLGACIFLLPSYFFFSLLARGLLTYLPFPGLATQKITVSFSELALDAKLVFSILHKSKGPWLPALRRS